MLLIEIGLAIVAWKRGWRWRVLIPFAIGLGAAFLIGVVVGASGGTMDQLTPITVILELSVLVSLIALAVRAPARKSAGSVSPTSLVAPVPVSVPTEPHGQI